LGCAGANCVVFCCLMVVVEKKANDTCFHTHTESTATYRLAELVEKNACPTSKQTLKSSAVAKSSFSLMQSCGRIKTEKPT